MTESQPEPASARVGWGIPLAFTAALLVASAFRYRDFGITWDEDIQGRYAEMLVRFYETRGKDGSAFAIRNLRHYGALFELLAGALARLTPATPFDTRHLANACVGSLAVLAATRIAFRIGGALAACLTGVFLIATPLYIGHLFNNPKDVPFAAAMAVAQCAFLGAWDEMPRPRWWRLILLGVAAGAVLGTRPESLPLLAVIWILFAAAWTLGRGRHGPEPRRAMRELLLTSLAIGVIAWLVMLAFWPYALRAPLRAPLEAFTLATHLNLRGQVLFAGSYVSSGRLPWSYLPRWSASVLPEFLALALAAGAAALGLRARSGAPIATERFFKGLFVAGCAFVPVLAAMVMRPSLYDGVRHFIFVLPALAALAGAALAAFLVSPVALAVRAATAAAVAALVGLTVVDMARIHPYEAAFFNRSTGGLPGAATRFETDYWLSSYKEAAEWLIANYGLGLPRKVRVAGLYESTPATYYLLKTPEGRRRFHAVAPDDAPHVVIATYRWDTWRKIDGRVLYVVERQGVPLAYVIETRRPLPFFAKNPRDDDPRLALR